MIEHLSLANNNKTSYNHTPKKGRQQDPAFTGFADAALNAVLMPVQLCEKYPMLNVSALDCTTAIGPRTVIESKTNAHAGFEALRRESSGLIVNCLIPSFVVLGISKLIEKPIMGAFKNSKMASCWANEDSINTVSKYYNAAQGATKREKVSNTFRNLLNDIQGVDGKDLVKIKDHNIDKEVEDLTNAVFSDKPSKLINKAYASLASKTHATENIKFNGEEKYFGHNLESIVDDSARLVKNFVSENITDSGKLAKFGKKAIHLVNAKSLLGLGVIIPLAASMQTINRWITHKTSGQKGAPIYKDFGKNNGETRPEDKATWSHKLTSAAAMVGVALLSMGGKLPTAKTLQFKGMFPTMDQARIISTSTFASRMLAAEDKNELREATIRDIATFSSLYFLGDYAAKGTASLIENSKFGKKNGIKLINTLKDLKPNANKLQKVAHWLKDTALKSSDEVTGQMAKNMRSVCQLSNLGFSLALLGVCIPLITRGQTAKKHKAELEKANVMDTNQYKHFIHTSTPSAKKTYQQFFTAAK